MKKRAILSGLAGLVVLMACGRAPVVDEASYLLIEQEAREAGFSWVSEDGTYEAVLPRALRAGGAATVSTPDGEISFEVGPDELLRVRADGTLSRTPLDQLDSGRVQVEGDRDAIDLLADEVGAEVIDREGARFLVAPDLIAELSAVDAPAGVDGVTVLTLDAVEVALPVMDVTAPTGVSTGGGTAARGVVEAVTPSGVSTNTAGARSASGCADPALGTWRSRQYSPWHGGWYEFTLTVRAAGADGLTGEILSHYWSGPSDRAEPPTNCSQYGEEWTVRMPATGSRAGGAFSFAGTSWSVAERVCGRTPQPGQYLLDRFTGGLTLDGDALKTVNNDGGVMVDEPTGFVRVSCGR